MAEQDPHWHGWQVPTALVTLAQRVTGLLERMLVVTPTMAMRLEMYRRMEAESSRAESTRSEKRSPAAVRRAPVDPQPIARVIIQDPLRHEP